MGNVDGAIAYIENIKSSKIKNNEKREEMVAYLERKKPNICCHAIRRAFNLMLSSNPSEKLNHIVVADREKHNGMRRSETGSCSLAILTANSSEQQRRKLGKK